MPIRIPGFSRGGGGESSGKKTQLETEIEKRGSVELTPKRDIIPGSEPKTYKDERGTLSYSEVPAVVNSNCDMDYHDGAYVIAPKEGRKYLEGGEAKVSIIDTQDARVVLIFRPSDEHFSQDGVGVSVVRDSEGGLRIGTALCDGKTKVKVSAALPSYVPYGEDRVYYSRAEQYATFAAGYFPRQLALGLRQDVRTGTYEGGSAKVISGALSELDKVNAGKTDQTPYGIELEVGGLPWGTTTVQMGSMRLYNRQMAVEVVNMGKADDIGENLLTQSLGAISRMGNTVGERPLELGRFGTPQGFKPERVLAASRAGSRSGVAVVPEQVFVQVSDGFTVPKGGIKINGGSLTMEQLLSMHAETLVGYLQTNATACFGNEKAPHDDGTLIAVVPKSVLRRNGFDPSVVYDEVFSSASQTPVVKEAPAISSIVRDTSVAEVSDESKAAGVTGALSEIAVVSAQALEQVIEEASNASEVQIAREVEPSSGITAQAVGPLPEEIAEGSAHSDELVPDPRLTLINEVKDLIKKGLSAEQRVTLEDLAVKLGVEVPTERSVRGELVQAVQLLARRFGTTIESEVLTGDMDAVLIGIAGRTEAKMIELKTLIETGYTTGSVKLNEIADLFELDIDPVAKKVAADRDKSRGKKSVKQ